MHVAIIMDGNRRWAIRHSIEYITGHYNGKENLKKILRLCPSKGIDTLTVYALSTENLKRKGDQVPNLHKLIGRTISEDYDELIEKGYRIKFLGNLEKLPNDLCDRLRLLEEESSKINNPSLLLQVCMVYGGRDEIVRAVNRLIERGEKVTEDSIAKYLDSDLEPELIIRTGCNVEGFVRTSNFLMWQSPYSEIYSTPTLWPDFGEEELDSAIEKFKKVNRNFGQ